MEAIENKVINYWSKRAESYSGSTQNSLNNKDEKTVWEELFYSQINKNKPLKILDVGTGPGFLAIVLANNKNYEVTGVDSSANMLKQATDNAQKDGVSVSFEVSDAHKIPFNDNTFDVVVSRCVTWNLPEPKQAYKEWKRVLKKGGKIINFDANWYLRLYNEELQKKYEAIEKYESVVPLEMRKKMESIAKELPLSRKTRPYWDFETLISLGFTKINVDANINGLIYNEIKKKMYESTPMFMICAIK